jgi:hypothetical protein
MTTDNSQRAFLETVAQAIRIKFSRAVEETRGSQIYGVSLRTVLERERNTFSTVAISAGTFFRA